ncbi:MAG: hypothetical protein M3Q36_00975 [bacterium]|nr:hypothetical protein [bacterium]
MMEYWQKQLQQSPLFPDILWSRPENRMGAGKLLIIGGSNIGFAAVGEAYGAAQNSGAGMVRVLLPDVLRKTVLPLIPEAEFASSTPSGSFAKEALNEWLIQAHWADCVLLAGDVGRNSETSILLDLFLEKFKGPITITKDCVDYFYSQPELIINRESTVVVLSVDQLQKIATKLHYEKPFLLSMGLMLVVQGLYDFTIKYPNVTIVTKELEHIIVAHNGRVSSTKLSSQLDKWRVSSAAAAATFWMQNPSKPFEAITTSLVAASQS